jgi:hypothetical protein
LYELELGESGGAAVLPEDVLAVVRVRYRLADGGKVEEIAHKVRVCDMGHSFDEMGCRFRLAACVAEFAEILRGAPNAKGMSRRDVSEVLRPVALELNLDGEVRGLLELLQR